MNLQRRTSPLIPSVVMAGTTTQVWAQEAVPTTAELQRTFENDALGAADGVTDWLISLVKSGPTLSEVSTSLQKIEWSALSQTSLALLLSLAGFALLYIALSKTFSALAKVYSKLPILETLGALLALVGASFGTYGLIKFANPEPGLAALS